MCEKHLLFIFFRFITTRVKSISIHYPAQIGLEVIVQSSGKISLTAELTHF